MPSIKTWLKSLFSKSQKSRIEQLIIKKIEKLNLSKSIKQVLIIGFELFYNILVIFFIVTFIRTFLISPFRVSGPSMCNTLNYHNNRCEQGPGDYLIINKLTYLNLFGLKLGEPNRGDIIVFETPHTKGEYFIKRIIGLPGETINLINGQVQIKNSQFPNGKFLEEPYLNSTNFNSTFPQYPGLTEFKVPENHYFVLGDNRTQSSDSRACFKDNSSNKGCEQKNDPNYTPFLHKRFIEGKAMLSIWPKLNLIESHNFNF